MWRGTNTQWIAAALAGLCAGLAWAAYEAATPPTSAAPHAQAGSVDLPVRSPKVVEPDFVMPPAEAFAAILERPIFSPTRRAAPDAAVVPTAARPELNVTLRGIVAAGEELTALLEANNGAEIVSLRKDESLYGWRLTTIAVDHVVFQRGPEQARFDLVFEQPPDAPSARGARRAQRRQPPQQEPLPEPQVEAPLDDEEFFFVDEEPEPANSFAAPKPNN